MEKSFITLRPDHLHDFLTFICGSLTLLNLKLFLCEYFKIFNAIYGNNPLYADVFFHLV